MFFVFVLSFPPLHKDFQSIPPKSIAPFWNWPVTVPPQLIHFIALFLSTADAWMHEAAGYKVVYSKQKYLQTYHHIFIEKPDRPPAQAQQRASFFRLPISFVPRYASCGRLPMSSTLEWQFATPVTICAGSAPRGPQLADIHDPRPVERPNSIRPVRPSTNAALVTAFGLLDSWHGFLKRLPLASILISLVTAFVGHFILGPLSGTKIGDLWCL